MIAVSLRQWLAAKMSSSLDFTSSAEMMPMLRDKKLKFKNLCLLDNGRLPCLLCLRCMKDTCIPEEKMLRDPRRLYAPGPLYHIVERKPFRLGRFPPVVRTVVPVDGRFEHIVLSCNATSDHAIIWIEREARRAMDLMLEKEDHGDPGKTENGTAGEFGKRTQSRVQSCTPKGCFIIGAMLIHLQDTEPSTS